MSVKRPAIWWLDARLMHTIFGLHLSYWKASVDHILD